MVSEISLAKCPIWGTDAEFLDTQGGKFEIVSNRAGGAYVITGSALSTVNQETYQGWKRIALTEHIFLANQHGITPRIDTDFLHGLKKPKNLNALRKLDRVLIAISDRSPRMGELFNAREIILGSNGEYLAAAINSPGAIPRDFSTELKFIIETAIKKGLLAESFEHAPPQSTITLDGWERIEELGYSLTLSDQIFVAMWFGDKEQAQLYSKAIKPAIEAAGYVAVRIDTTEHNEKIDDQIIAEIRKSKAVVVDLTCGLASPIGTWTKAQTVGAPRGGVFYEAGFAMGLGLPVIWSVKQEIAEHENVVHFDVRQYNQLRWTSDLEDFKERLRFRIEATIGRGNITAAG